ncbi:hypothetical protein [Streptomyces varsoviensis]|uniref:hypothetical protein n=1 Tax=Streptomyces varsoviensis TaxID=67373 RepID=UPI0006625162|nr:hypothetical protein [Streptomyces varsoviensis]
MTLASSVMVPYTAYLRVYEPLAAFPEPERGHWARYARRETLPSAQDELRRSLADLLPTPPVAVPVHESGDAFVAVVDGVTCVCPWRTRLRGWQALEGLTDQLPGLVLDAALPPVVRRQAEADYERWLERNPDARPWIKTATWHVPVRWFVLFAAEEREYDKGDEGLVLRYRTPVVEVGRWLEEFHPRSLVELDYGGLVHVVPEADLADDRSVEDVAEGLTALREGDGAGAGAAYERLTERWSAVRDRQYAS